MQPAAILHQTGHGNLWPLDTVTWRGVLWEYGYHPVEGALDTIVTVSCFCLRIVRVAVEHFGSKGPLRFVKIGGYVWEVLGHATRTLAHTWWVR